MARTGLRLIDSLIIAAGAGLLSWILLIAPYAHDASLPALVKLTAIAYPLCDLLLLSVAVRLAFGGGEHGRSIQLIVASICALFATDAIYGWLELHGGYRPGSLLDGGWILFYLLFAAAALHPSMATAGRGAPAPLRLTRTRLVVLTVATFVAPVTGLLAPAKTSDRIVIAACAIVLFGLVLLRMVGVVQGQEAESARLRSLEETADRLRQLDQLKDQFVATVSHELRTPLTSINGYLELVLDRRSGALADEQREFLSIVARNTDRLRKLVDDLLLVSEIDAGKLKLDVGRSRSARAHAGESRVSSPAGSRRRSQSRPRGRRAGSANRRPSAARAAPRQHDLERDQVHTPGGSVSLRMSRSNGTELVEVEDTGIGMSVSEENDVFDRFYRTRAADEGAIQGTGLGLSISQAIAHAHGGQIDVSSTENVGTTFCVALPAKT